jgi:hypothetical protein
MRKHYGSIFGALATVVVALTYLDVASVLVTRSSTRSCASAPSRTRRRMSMLASGEPRPPPDPPDATGCCSARGGCERE